MASSPLSSFETTSQPHLAPFLSLKNIHILHIDLLWERDRSTRVFLDRLPHREPLGLEELRISVGRREVFLPLHLLNPTSCIFTGTSNISRTTTDGKRLPSSSGLDLGSSTCFASPSLSVGVPTTPYPHNPLHQYRSASDHLRALVV